MAVLGLSMDDRYVACMGLGGVGDALGYHDGAWEFNFNGQDIADQLPEGGVLALRLRGKSWCVPLHLPQNEQSIRFYTTVSVALLAEA